MADRNADDSNEPRPVDGQLEGLLADAAEERDAVLAEAAALDRSPREDRAAALLAAQVASVTAPNAQPNAGRGSGGGSPAGRRPAECSAATTADSPPRRRPTLVLAALAAAAAAALLFVLLDRPTAEQTGVEDQPYFLGPGDKPELLSPVGSVGSFSRFEWRAETEPGWRFEIELYDLDTGQLLAGPVRVTGLSWQAPDDLDLSRVIRLAWTVTPIDPSGNPRTSASGEAERIEGTAAIAGPRHPAKAVRVADRLETPAWRRGAGGAEPARGHRAGDGRTPDGTSPDGASQDGASQDGASQDGASQDGASQDGASQDGDPPGAIDQVDAVPDYPSIKAELDRGKALTAKVATRAEGIAVLAGVLDALGSELDPVKHPGQAWCYVRAVVQVIALEPTEAEFGGPVDYPALVASARRCAGGDQESGAMVELAWSGHWSRRGELLRAERIAADGIANYPGAVGYGSNLRLDRARCLRRLARWSDALAALDELEMHLNGNATYLGQYVNGYRAGLWGERASIWTELGAFDDALDCLEEEAGFAAASGRAKDRLNAEQHRSEYELLTRDFDSAAERMEAQLAEAPPIAGDRRAIVATLLTLIRVEQARVDPKAYALATRTLAAAREEPGMQRPERVRLEVAGADLATSAGEFDAAREYLERARAAADEWSRDEQSPRLEVRRLIELQGSRLARASGADKATLRSWSDRIEALLAEFIEEWSNAPTPPTGIGVLHVGDRRQILVEAARLALATADDEEEGTMRALGALARAQAQGSAFRQSELPPVDLEALRPGLAPGHGLAVYLPDREVSMLFLIDRDRARTVDLPALHDLRRAGRSLAARLRALVRSDETIESTLFGLRLERDGPVLLPDEALTHIEGWDRLTVIGAELFHEPPLGSLSVGEGDELLGERVALEYAPSLPLWSHLREGEQPALPEDAPDLLLVGTLDVSEALSEQYPKLSPRELGPVEIAPIRSAAEDWRVETLLGSAATAQALRDLKPDRARVLGLLAHGLWDSVNESQLALAGEGLDGLLTREDIVELEFPGVVLLAACKASQGYERFGDDRLLHLGGAFLDGGAKCVVLSRTDVELEFALEMLAGVTAALADGAPPAEALRRARAERSADLELADRWRACSLYVLGYGRDSVTPSAR